MLLFLFLMVSLLKSFFKLENTFFWNTFLVFSIALCRSEFPRDIIFLLPEKLTIVFFNYAVLRTVNTFVCLKRS